jgi:hypothetical protein
MMQEGPPQLTVAGACGLTIDLPVNGVDVRFTCSPSGQAAPTGPILRPEEPGPGDYALFMPSEDALVMPTAARWLRPDYFAVQRELDPSAEPMVIATSLGEEMEIGDWMHRLGAARDERRAVVLKVETHGGR